MHPDGGIDANFYNECVLCKAEVGRLPANCTRDEQDGMTPRQGPGALSRRQLGSMNPQARRSGLAARIRRARQLVSDQAAIKHRPKDGPHVVA
jgi:hypothetical protein